jgi:hypothetical protein
MFLIIVGIYNNKSEVEWNFYARQIIVSVW